MTELTDYILDRINNLVVVVNDTGEVEYVSPAAKNILGYEPDQLLGNGWWNHTRRNVQEREIERQKVRQLADGSVELSTTPYERKLQTANGESKWILWNTTRGPDNTLIGIGYDVTEKKLAEERLALRQEQMDDSIEYASRIQQAMLPDVNTMMEPFAGLFVYYQPKDVVSGDFYWYYKKGHKVFIAAADCTGHGVPGALVSVLGNAILREIIIKKGVEDPGEILNQLDSEMVHALSKQGAGPETSDGMDIALAQFDLDARKVHFAGAFRPLLLIRAGELVGFDGGRFPIGYYYGIEKKFTTKMLRLQTGDLFYMLSDGYTDQFGGENVRKFNRNRFRNLLLSIKDMSMGRQKKELKESFSYWKGKNEQVDDVLVIGIRI